MATATKKETVARGSSRAGKTLPQESKGPKRDIAARRGAPNKFAKLASPHLAARIKSCGGNISLIDVAEAFGVTTQTVRLWSLNGQLPEAFFIAGSGDRKLYMSSEQVVRKINAALDRKPLAL